MAIMKIAALLLICFLPAGAQPAPGTQTLEADFDALARYEEGASRAPLVRVEERVRGALASPSAVRALERRFVDLLDSGATFAAKDFACRQLSLIGTGASVPVLARLMEDASTFEIARYALARIPGHEADRALVERLLRGPRNERLAILQTLGSRSSSACVPSIVPLAKSDDPEVAAAAVAALGALGSEQACRAVVLLQEPAGDALAEAKLRCAEQSLAAGRKTEALELYRGLYAEGQPQMTRAAALLGWAAAAGGDAPPFLEKAVREESGAVRAAAIRALASVPGAEARALLAKSFDSLDETGQVQVVSALAERGSPEARKVLIAAAASPSAAVRTAALAGLGTLGTAEDAALLAERCAKGEGREQELARESLYRLHAPGTDEKILALIGAAGPEVKIELMRAAGERAIASAAPALLTAARDPDRSVRREALRALRDTASRSDVPSLMGLLSGAPDRATRVEAQQTLASVMRRTGASAAAVHERFERTDNGVERAALLWVMGQLGEPSSLPAIRRALASQDDAVRRQAILSLSEWADPSPADDLYSIAADRNASAAHRTLALRGYIRLASLPSKRPHAETAKLLEKAAGAAERAEEKKTILGLLRRYPCRESLDLARSLSRDPALVEEAGIAIERIAEALETAREP